jgi:hypothetical protein
MLFYSIELDNQAHNNYLSIEDADEEDPLEAFMADISNKAAEEKTEPKLRRDDLEEEDEMESYVNHMKKKGIVVGSNNGIAERSEVRVPSTFVYFICHKFKHDTIKLAVGCRLR